MSVFGLYLYVYRSARHFPFYDSCKSEDLAIPNEIQHVVGTCPAELMQPRIRMRQFSRGIRSIAAARKSITGSELVQTASSRSRCEVSIEPGDIHGVSRSTARAPC
jgi:hypothetical protein